MYIFLRPKCMLIFSEKLISNLWRECSVDVNGIAVSPRLKNFRIDTCNIEELKINLSNRL